MSGDCHVGQLFLSLPFPCQELFPVFLGLKEVNNVTTGQKIVSCSFLQKNVHRCRLHSVLKYSGTVKSVFQTEHAVKSDKSKCIWLVELEQMLLCEFQMLGFYSVSLCSGFA